MFRFYRRVFWFFVAALSLVHSAQARPFVRAQSVGEAYRAVASGTDIVFYNPAGILKHRRVGVDADYFLNSHEALHSLSLSLMDAKTSAWGLGLGYSAGLSEKASQAASHDLVLGLAMPILTDMFALGASFSYAFNPLVPRDAQRHFFNIDLGLLAQFGAGLSFALVVDHILGAKAYEKPLGLGLGTAFALGDLLEAVPLTLSFDWSMRDLKSAKSLEHELGVGLQYVALDFLPLRAGYQADPKDHAHFMSLGSGFLSSIIAVDAVYKQNLLKGKYRYFGLALRLTF